jgi:cell division protein ZapA (FtsZ GTPase activity inhibitor)
MMIELPIGKSNYQIPCKKSEQEKLSKLAEKLNKRLNRLSSQVDGDEKTLLAIAALSLEGELELASEIEAPESGINEKDIEDAISETMENISDYIEKLSKRIQRY